MIACRKSFTDTLLELARQDKDIVVVTTDARGSVTLGDFAKELPAQFVECGIAEQDAVGISAGLAHSGKKVFVCGPACFYVARSLEQVKVDLAYSQNNVKILGVSGGVAYGALGATHHSLHDIAVLRTFPGMNIVLPCDARQTREELSLWKSIVSLVVWELLWLRRFPKIRFRYALSASPMRTWFMETPMKSLPITDWIKRASARLPLNS